MIARRGGAEKMLKREVVNALCYFLSFSLHPSLSAPAPFDRPPVFPFLCLALSFDFYLDSNPAPSSGITYSTSPSQARIDGLERELSGY
jgi:hypothetical protein